MISQIHVHEVEDVNACDGKKTITITAQEDMSLFKSRFILDRRYTFPQQKLILSTVSPEDEVRVYIDECSGNPVIMGDFTDILSRVHDRTTLCRCGATLISDGFDVYCPHTHCGLTLATRLRRLGKTRFFDTSYFVDNSQRVREYEPIQVVIGDDPQYHCPFNILLEPRFWERPYDTLETILLDDRTCVNLSTFMIESEFNRHIDNHLFNTTLHPSEFRNIFRFYEAMDDFCKNRNNESYRQRLFIREFLWCLGLESLTVELIDKLIQYEMCNGMMSYPLVPYIVALTRAQELTRMIGCHPLEAQMITQEVHRRRYELFDIFACYSSLEIVSEVFLPMIPA